ncbi:MAG: M20/M25/M40 family metallo-hydrolase [Acidobacteriia bacterium]|nr:M20/M25/M40 family metallo-hydrolase [Terriglobia bacterium]
MPTRFALILAFLGCLCSFPQSKSPGFTVTPEVRGALDSIRADALRGDLSFLASDLLEGRNTPSRGLDIAAEYIAAQFRGAGLELGGDDGYFQTARMAVLEPDLTGFELALSHAGRVLKVEPSAAALNVTTALELDGAPVFKVDVEDDQFVESLTAPQLDGKVVLVEIRRSAGRNLRVALRKLGDAKPAAVILLDPAGATGRPSREGQLMDPETPRRATPWITLTGQSAAAFYGSLKAGASGATATIHVAAPRQSPVRLRNVIGILRGSDASLKDTCMLVTAHYDHLGEDPNAKGDRIYNGANDDGSGVVTVIELARALASLKEHPRRSIVFMTFFGEEKGLMGSRYYARHPAWPLEKTIAQLNFEQVGRTDSTEGKQLSNATLTGFDYSDLSNYLERAGELTGIKVYKNSRNSDLYFTASDNEPLADVGVPSTTLAVAFDFPDYHGVGDEWQKIDYDNMAKVDRAAALMLIMLASSDQPPHWNAANPKAAPFLKARQAHR